MSAEGGAMVVVERADLCLLPGPALAPLGEGLGAAALRFPDLRPADPLPGPPLPPAALDPGMERAVAKRQIEFVAGRLAAREALRQLGRPGGDWIGRGADRAPVWPAGFRGAISHSRGLAWSVVARVEDRRGIGIDVEGLVSPSAAEAVSKMVLVPGERPRLAAAGEDERLGLTLTFAAKECLFKCLYPTVQRMFGFEAAELLWIDHVEGAFGLRLREALHSSLPVGAAFHGRFQRLSPEGVRDAEGGALAAVIEWR